MTHGGRQGAALLFLGDIATFVVALWLTLFLRYQALPGTAIFKAHLGPFAVLFVLWVFVFYLSGLYGKRIVLFKSRLADALLKTQVFNIVLAALFFFLVPWVGIAPKTNLVLYLIVSLALIFFWRLALYPKLSTRRARFRAALIASGAEADELVHEVNGNPRYHLEFAYVHTPEELAGLSSSALEAEFEKHNVSMLVVDTEHPVAKELLPLIYHLSCFTRTYQFSEFTQIYEEVFDRIPLSLLQHEWFLKNVSTNPSIVYVAGKRAIDIIGSLIVGVITIIATPFVWIAQKIEGPGPVFITQVRIGECGKPINAYKFRSMTKNLTASGEWPTESDNRITRVGNFLRMSSLDEFPQWINVLRGEISLIGPRSDIEGLGHRLAEAIPYYNARYIVRPGITGWAQINQQYEQGSISPSSIEETKTRLAYDFYYLKNRSLGLDIVIALRTIKRMLFRVSSW
jgi:lipopolysaccharide/colanic/teichoic acid biosynthesis glycosyltransferase